MSDNPSAKAGTSFKRNRRWLNTAVITVFLTAVVGPLAVAYAKGQQETKKLQVEIMRQMIESVAETEFLREDGVLVSDGFFKLAATATLVTQNQPAIGLNFSDTSDRLLQIAERLDRTRVKELEGSKAELEVSKQLLEADIAEMEKSRRQLLAERETLQENAEQHGEEMQFYRENREANRRLINSLDEELSAANRLKSRYGDELAAKERELIEARGELREISVESASRDQKLTALEADLQRRNQLIEQLQTQASKSAATHQRQVTGLEEELGELRKSYRQLVVEKDQLDADRDRLAAENQRLLNQQPLDVPSTEPEEAGPNNTNETEPSTTESSEDRASELTHARGRMAADFANAR